MNAKISVIARNYNTNRNYNKISCYVCNLACRWLITENAKIEKLK